MVHYSGASGLCACFFAFSLLGWLFWMGAFTEPLFLPLTIPAGAWTLHSLGQMAMALDRRPMFVIDPTGIVLPWSNGERINFEDLDSFWFTLNDFGDRSARHWSLSLQCIPRRYIDRPLWARARGNRTHTLLDGDVKFDCRYLSIATTELASFLAASHPGGWLDRANGVKTWDNELDAILPRGR